jgi:hypothetical protein
MNIYRLSLLFFWWIESVRTFLPQPLPNCRWKSADDLQQLVATNTSAIPLTTDEDTHDTYDKFFQQAQWLMPSIIERALVHGDVTVDPDELLDRLDLGATERAQALVALYQTDNTAVQTIPNVLTPQECFRLRTYLDKNIQNDGIDTVDGCPDWQINISSKKLGKIVGPQVIARLYTVLPNSTLAAAVSKVGVFLRRYQASARPWMPFHRDANNWTVNVALNKNIHEDKGGQLLVLQRGKLEIVPRKEGDATCHDSSVFHAVSAMRGEWVRYSLILFFHL